MYRNLRYTSTYFNKEDWDIMFNGLFYLLSWMSLLIWRHLGEWENKPRLYVDFTVKIAIILNQNFKDYYYFVLLQYNQWTCVNVVFLVMATFQCLGELQWAKRHCKWRTLWSHRQASISCWWQVWIGSGNQAPSVYLWGAEVNGKKIPEVSCQHWTYSFWVDL